LNKNPYAPAVPCHRVVGSDGSLTGFAGGIEKKKELLEKEGVAMRGDRVLMTGRHRF
jgi:methylated-DNA-[protein]-cysteine S-methyltransferase